MLHEPEFESADEQPEAGSETAQTPSRSGKVFRGVLYASLVAVFGLAVGVNASPKFAETVGASVPEPVAAAMSSMTGVEMTALSSDGGSCCSTMTRASLMMASEEGCCSEAMCPLEKAAMMAAAAESSAGACCSSSMTDSAVASTESECTGACPLSGSTESDLLAGVSEEGSEAAVSLPAPSTEENATEQADAPVEVELTEEVAVEEQVVETSI